MKNLYLIDAYSFLYRAYHVMPELTNPTGVPIGAVYGFTKMLIKLLNGHKPDLAVVAYDHSSPTLRKQIYPAYKGNRTRPDDMYPQLALARQASRALGFMNIELPGYEADDIIATLTRRAEAAGLGVVIISPDKDLMQLIRKDTVMIDPLTNNLIMDYEVEKKFGVPPRRLRDVLALTGDVADNIPGVPKIGLKGAADLIREFGDLPSLLRDAHNVRKNAARDSLLRNMDKAWLSYELISLYFDAPVNVELSDMKVLYNKATVEDFCNLHEFASILKML